MLATVGGLLLKLFGSGLLTPILAHLTAKADAQRDIAVAGIGADQARDLALVQAEVAANAQASALAGTFPWMVWLTWAPFALHLWAVAVVTVTGAEVTVPAFPATFQSWEGIVLLAPFVHHPIAEYARGVARR